MKYEFETKIKNSADIEIRVNGKLAFRTSEPLTEEERDQRVLDILSAPIDPESIGSTGNRD